jgi:hypothetical protein
VVDACAKNFRGEVTLADVQPGDVFDQETLSDMLAAIERAHCAERGIAPGPRVELAEVLRRLR